MICTNLHIKFDNRLQGRQAKVRGVHVALGDAVPHIDDHIQVTLEFVDLDLVTEDEEELVSCLLDFFGELGLGQVIFERVLNDSSKRFAKIGVLAEGELGEGHRDLHADLQQTSLLGGLVVLLHEKVEEGGCVLANRGDRRRALLQNCVTKLVAEDVSIGENGSGELEDEIFHGAEELDKGGFALEHLKALHEKREHLLGLRGVSGFGALVGKNHIKDIQQDQSGLRSQ